jgi:hypothetical protein
MKNLPLLVAIALLLVGCGPSAGERKALAELADTQKRLAASATELDGAKAQIAKDQKEKADEQRSLGVQLADAQKAATAAQARVKELEEQIRSDLPPPQYEISGEVFIATRGGSNFKLGLVEIVAIEKGKAVDFVAAKTKEQLKLLTDLQPKLDKARKERDESAAIAEAAFKAVLDGIGSGRRDLEQVQKNRAAADVISAEKNKEWITLSSLNSSIISGNFYFSALPESCATAKTNSDGKFKLSVGRDKEVVVAAHARRSVGDSTEQYFWMVPVERPARGGNVEVILSNDNLTSAKGASLFESYDG